MAGAEPVVLGLLGDVHGRMDWLRQVLEAMEQERPQAYLLVGDLAADDELRDSGRRVLATVAATGRPVVYVPGNHDLPDLDGRPYARNADGRWVEVAGLGVWGIGGSGPARFGFPYEWGEDWVRQLPRQQAEVLLAHCPPKGCAADRTASGHAAGSQAIRELLESGDLRLCVCGHIHEAAGCERVGATPCFNLGSLGSPYGAPQYGLAIFGPDELRLEHVVLPHEPELPRFSWAPPLPPCAPGRRIWRFPSRPMTTPAR